MLQGFNTDRDPQKVCRLLKYVYELKQVSRQWNIKLTSTLPTTELTQSHHDYSLFTKKVAVNTTRNLVFNGNKSRLKRIKSRH